jgi:GNAT superfamily N-acetyltransferase
MEDVYVNSNYRGKGLGTSLVKKIIEMAKEQGCYKLVATSRHSRERVHKIYESLGFKNFGIEFRMNLE